MVACASAGLDYGIDVGVFFYLSLNKKRSRSGEHVLNGFFQLSLCGHSATGNIVCGGNLHKIRVLQLLEIVVSLVVKILQLANGIGIEMLQLQQNMKKKCMEMEKKNITIQIMLSLII